MTLPDSIGDKATGKYHKKQTQKENGISNSFDPMHTVQTARPQSPIGEQAGEQEDDRIYRQKIVYKGFDFACADDNPQETNHGKTDAHKRCGNGEDVDADIRFELPL